MSTKAASIFRATDPYNIRPAAEALASRITAMRVGLGPDESLVVLFGEDHERPADSLLLALVCDILAAQGLALGCGYEMPHNYAGMKLSSNGSSRYSLSPAQCAHVSAEDKNGTLALRMHLAYGDGRMAPVTRQAVFARFLKSGIAVHFNDAANENKVLDNKDPETARLLKKFAPHAAPGRVHIHDALGLDIRNHALAGNIQRRLTPGMIYIQHCGRNHVFGDAEMGCSYEQSLDALLRAQNIKTLPVYINNDETDTIPPEAPRDECFFISGMADERFSDINTSEAAFLKRLCDHSGADLEVFTEGLFFSDRARLRSELSREMPGLFTRAKELEL